MARWLQLILPIVILVVALAVRGTNPKVFETLDLKLFDLYQQKSPRQYSAKMAGTTVPMPVKVVDIDDGSLRRYGQWPWPRSLVAKLVEAIGGAGAAVIAFDIVFSEPDRTSPSRIAELWTGTEELERMRPLIARLPDHDHLLAETLRQSRVVAGFVLTGRKNAELPKRKTGLAFLGGDPTSFVQPVYSGAVRNLPEIESAAAGNGSLNIVPEQDQIIRRMPIVARLGDQLYPSIVAEALRVAQGARTMLVRSRMHGGGESLGKAPGIVDVKIGSVVIPTDAQGRFWIHHTGPDPRRTIPAWKVLRGRFKPADLAGKIVFVGSSASALNDLRASPLHSATAGVEFHAQVAEQILNHEFLSRPEWAEGAEIAIAFVAGVLVVLIVYRVGAAWGGLVAMTMVVGGSISSWLLFKEHGLLTAPLFPALTTGGVFLMASMTSYLRSEASRREVKSVFGRYISPVVLERLAANPGHIQLGGELRDMSVLFCDIRGFTALSEQMDAKSLTAFVNAFLTPMTSAIHSNEGTVDKYLGDAVMAFWNAPVDDSRHALHACRASLAMCAELVRFNEQRAVASNLGAEGGYRDPIRVGIGIGTGMCCVGNMGSRQRFDYSVVGDTVNLASRLEGLTKTYGVAIVISEETRAEAQGLAALELDVTRVKGKSRAVRIYALLGDEGLATDPSFRELASVHANMLEACREGEWMRAQECVDRLRSMDMARELALLTLYELYQARVEGLGQQDVERTQAV